MNVLALQDVDVSLGSSALLKGVSFEVKASKLVGLIGPNGAGKTTAVRALLGQQKLTSGMASINGQNVAAMSHKVRAQQIAYLPQSRTLAWPISVREAVSLGRFVYGGALGRLSPADKEAVEHALMQCDLMAFANRSVASLSGGELARVHMARACAAQTPALIADEPIAALDPRHALDVLGLLKDKAQSGAAVLVILHDLTWAAQFCDEIILLDQGKVVATGTPEDVLTPDAIAKVFQVTAAWQNERLQISP